MGERMTWDEIVKKYPGMWVFLEEVEWNMHKGMKVDIKSAILVDVVTDHDVDDRRDYFYDQGKDYLVRRTTDDINMGVIHCENYHMSV